MLSSYLEGLCTSIMDAHALGVPVVATDVGGVPDLVADGETGLLVEPRNPEALAAAIVRMLGEASLRSACRANGRQKSAGYDYNVMVYKTLAAYRSLTDAEESRATTRSSGI